MANEILGTGLSRIGNQTLLQMKTTYKNNKFCKLNKCNKTSKLESNITNNISRKSFVFFYAFPLAFLCMFQTFFAKTAYQIRSQEWFWSWSYSQILIILFICVMVLYHGHKLKVKFSAKKYDHHRYVFPKPSTIFVCAFSRFHGSK